MLCKKRGVLKEVQAAFRQRTVKKKYTLIAQGPWPGKVRAVRDRLLRYETDWGERRVRVDAKGQIARTDFQILERAEHATLLQAALHTGRTHQIRVHAQSQGHPILGDTKYGAQLKQRKLTACAYTHRDWSCPWVMTDWIVSAPLEPKMVNIWEELQVGRSNKLQINGKRSGQPLRGSIPNSRKWVVNAMSGRPISALGSSART